MTVVTYWNVLRDRTRRGFEQTLPDLVADARREAQSHSRTGEYAASLRHGRVAGFGDRFRARIGSPLVQAGAVERGADVGPRKGPHMRGLNILVTAMESYPDRLANRLRGGY